MRKKLFTSLIALAAMLTFSPQAWGQVDEYFSITCNSNSGSVKMTYNGTPGTVFYYSTDKTNWTQITGTTELLCTTSLTYYFKGNNSTGFSKNESDYIQFNLKSYTYYLKGNIMSLVYENDFATKGDVMPSEYCFYKMFYASSTGNIDASGLTMPANELKAHCYENMFRESKLTNLPQLPAQKLANSCYKYMFYRCQSIATMADYYILPAEELAPHCYEYMFGYYTESPSTTQKFEIMATSLQDRKGVDIENCLTNTFGFQVNGTKNLTYEVKFYFRNWVASGSIDSKSPTYNWFLGNKNTGTKNKLYYDSQISSTTAGASQFPTSCSKTSQTPDYLTFDCKTNGGTWEEGSTYNADMRRVVRSDYTAKTIPANPYKANNRFLGWFTSGGVLMSENDLKKVTTATTVYARFAGNSQYSLAVGIPENGTIEVSDGVNKYSSGSFTLFDDKTKTFTVTYTNNTAGYTFYQWIGTKQTQATTLTLTFDDAKDLMVNAIFAGTSSSTAKTYDIYQDGKKAGSIKAYDLPTEAVDMGAAGVWAKYNVKAEGTHGFTQNETEIGDYFAWGRTNSVETNSTTYYTDVVSMAVGTNLPVNATVDAAVKYCGKGWRIPTQADWENLLANATCSNDNGNCRMTSRSNPSNSIIIPKGGYMSNGTTTSAAMSTYALYWSSTLTAIGGNYKYQSQATIFYYNSTSNKGVNSSSTTPMNRYIYYRLPIRPIFDMQPIKIDIITPGGSYSYACDMWQKLTIKANSSVQGEDFIAWQDEKGDTISTENPLVIKAYENARYTAVFGAAATQYHITFVDDDEKTVLDEKDVYEDNMPVYKTGTETPTKEGYEFNGWEPEIVAATEDATYKATYIPYCTISTVTNNQGIVTLTSESSLPATGSAIYLFGTEIKLSVTPNEGFVFTKWSDGDTESPRTITITSDTTFTAEFGIESKDTSVTASQGTTHDVTQIVYYLKPSIYNEITYTPVDMGYGVAWADKNMGAATTNDIGGYYYWGGLEPATTFKRNIDYGYMGTYNMNSGDKLPMNADVANVNLGSRWHIPSNTEWQDLITKTDMNNYTYTSRSNSNNSIFLPATGEYDTPYNSNPTSTVTDEQSRYYWSNTLYESNKSSWVNSNPYYFFQNSVIYGTNTNGKSGVCTNGMPVRAIYTPPFTPDTLTIHVGNYDYVYLCQEGQKVTVTPTPATGYTFDKWQDNESTTAARTFTIGNQNAEYTATFKVIPQTFTVTIANGNSEYGSVDQTSLTDVVDGTAISVNGNTLTINGTTVTATANEANALYTYAFTGWTGTAATVTDNMTITANFTATQKEYFELVDTARVGDNFYTILDTLAGKEKNVKYMRTFPEGTDAPTWNVFSLPFDYYVAGDENLRDRVLDLKNASYDAYTGTLTLYFVYAISIEANYPYVFYNKGAELKNPVFNGVTIEKPEVKTDYSVECMPNGEVYFMNTIVRGPLEENSNIAFLYNNKLYYSGKNNKMRAFCGYFKMNGVVGAGSSAPRRIVMMVDEATGLTSEMEVTSIDTKKVIEDGILYIERNGIRYDAQGATVK